VICQLSVDIVWCHVVIFLKQLHYEYCYILCRMPLAHKCSRSCVECYYCCPAMLMLVEAVVAKSPPVIELHQHRYISVCDTNRRPSAVREPDCLQMEAGYTRDLFLRNPNAIPFYFIIFYDLFIVFWWESIKFQRRCYRLSTLPPYCAKGICVSVLWTTPQVFAFRDQSNGTEISSVVANGVTLSLHLRKTSNFM
jgi:hypothetical protein